MTTTSVRWLLWIPRVLGILAGLFLGLFALDAFSEGKPFAQSLADFIIHLAPAAVLLAVVALAWRWAWVGAAAFIGLALAYAASNAGRPDWILTISGPLAIVGALFFWSWRQSRAPSRARGSAVAGSLEACDAHARVRGRTRNSSRMAPNIPRRWRTAVCCGWPQ